MARNEKITKSNKLPNPTSYRSGKLPIITLGKLLIGGVTDYRIKKVTECGIANFSKLLNQESY